MAEHKVDSPKTLPGWIFPWPDFSIDKTRAALVIIDYQNYSVNPECGLTKLIIERYPSIANYYIPRFSQVTIPNTKRLLKAFRNAGREVIYTRNGSYLPDGRDLIHRRRQRDNLAMQSSGLPTLWSKGTFEHKIVHDLSPLDGEYILDKNCSSPFNGTGIDQVLRNLGIELLIMTGMATDMCVETTARDASDRGYSVVVVEDSVVTFREDHHYAALSALARVYTQVWTTNQVMEKLGL